MQPRRDLFWDIGKKYSPGTWSYGVVIRGRFLYWLHERMLLTFDAAERRLSL